MFVQGAAQEVVQAAPQAAVLEAEQAVLEAEQALAFWFQMVPELPSWSLSVLGLAQEPLP